MTDRIIGPDTDFRNSDTIHLHSTCLCVGQSAALLVGGSGTGKSSFALQALALGAELVSDDQTILTRSDEGVIATCPDPIQGRIEARGVGLLQVIPRQAALLQLVIDMDMVETDRLPPHRGCRILGIRLPLLHKVESTYFPAAVMQYLQGGRCD